MVASTKNRNAMCVLGVSSTIVLFKLFAISYVLFTSCEKCDIGIGEDCSVWMMVNTKVTPIDGNDTVLFP